MSESQPIPRDDQPTPPPPGGTGPTGSTADAPYTAPDQGSSQGSSQGPAQGPAQTDPGADPGQGQQPPYAQPGYGQQPYGSSYGPAYGQPYGQGYAPPPYVKTNTMAIISLVSSVLGLTFVPVLGSIAGVITGHMARRQIADTGEQGSGVATAGLVVGYVGIALVVLVVVGFILFFALAAGVASTSP
ncbi:DUF4190 domain-containing protein [Cellulomonas carbonis]|uniref:DUF4190 domain-containing protein n=1 Tax=Cellulomonas carbonis T26 TaxID=947969 RepID=A0A0A0BQD4_9CELL|nr:DUF4190 domain-containing protein [Cellulomonas carbonis]KGM10683.1 hypothetical protein N868_14065 [Cellulomonas carbonis T26]GGC07711.1 hypothetical protein GCM10010972_21230 [Cellulomonas carbonis]